ncbi:hypothetical protein [Treponema pectinovorum]|uniref:hypothetical protein n=1 Tax=Treponema pectinovorum TaxID=164 RepID=UPI0011CCA750|nr:hypothetical protein [Treponema pectinovorum]
MMMKKICLVALFLFISTIYAQDVNSEESSWLDEVYLQFDEGFSLLSVTRIQKESRRSNFVWSDAMIGAFFSVKTKNLPFLDVNLRLQALYPFQHQFNGMEQFSKQTILYAFDGFLGPYFKWNLFKHYNFSVTPGLHYMYQLSDEYHYSYVGAGGIFGVEFPVTKKWTIILDGTFTWDNANVGSNKNVQPYDYSWQWGSSIGVRYSRLGTTW